jgi:hypothetical protein
MDWKRRMNDGGDMGECLADRRWRRPSCDRYRSDSLAELPEEKSSEWNAQSHPDETFDYQHCAFSMVLEGLGIKELKPAEIRALISLMQRTFRAAGIESERSRMALRRKRVGMAWINRNYRHPAIDNADIVDLVSRARCEST